MFVIEKIINIAIKKTLLSSVHYRLTKRSDASAFYHNDKYLGQKQGIIVHLKIYKIIKPKFTNTRAIKQLFSLTNAFRTIIIHDNQHH